MCTSFVLYSDKTYIGMNFDISDRPIKICFKENNQFLILQKDRGSFFPAFGINKNGIFMNLLMVEPNEKGKYRRGKNCVHISKIFDDVLAEQISLDKLDTLLQEKTIVNVPNISVHSMVVAKDRRAYIIEPGRTNINFKTFDKDFMVLTNFPLSDFIDQDNVNETGVGADRYMLCSKMLLDNQNSFDVDYGFSILDATSQTSGDYPTQLSMLAVPEDEIIYFTIKRSFEKRFAFSFANNTLQSLKGFTQQQDTIITKKGVLFSELEQWK